MFAINDKIVVTLNGGATIGGKYLGKDIDKVGINIMTSSIIKNENTKRSMSFIPWSAICCVDYEDYIEFDKDKTFNNDYCPND